MICAIALACDAPSGSPDAAIDAELRFGSHTPCASSSECPDAETCAYATALGCAAAGECVSATRCSEHNQVPTACLCDGGTVLASACDVLPASGYLPMPVQGLGFCPGDPNAPASDGGLPVGESCSFYGDASCASGSTCSGLIDATCCVPAYEPCAADSDCCNGWRCDDTHASYKRCTP